MNSAPLVVRGTARVRTLASRLSLNPTDRHTDAKPCANGRVTKSAASAISSST